MLIWALPLLPLLVIAGGISGFLSASQPLLPPPDPTGLAGTAWQVETLAGTAAGGDPRQTVEFAVDGQVTGEGGCNGYFGAYGLQGERLVVGPLVATRMACPDPVMQRERRLLEALEAAFAWRRSGHALELLASDGQVLIRLMPSADGG